MDLSQHNPLLFRIGLHIYEHNIKSDYFLHSYRLSCFKSNKLLLGCFKKRTFDNNNNNVNSFKFFVQIITYEINNIFTDCTDNKI